MPGKGSQILAGLKYQGPISVVVRVFLTNGINSGVFTIRNGKIIILKLNANLDRIQRDRRNFNARDLSVLLDIFHSQHHQRINKFVGPRLPRKRSESLRFVVRVPPRFTPKHRQHRKHGH